MGKSKNSKYYIEDDEIENTDHKKTFQEQRIKRKLKEQVKILNVKDDVDYVIKEK